MVGRGARRVTTAPRQGFFPADYYLPDNTRPRLPK